MNSYLFTITFLMMMSFLTSSEIVRYAQNNLEQICYQHAKELKVTTEELGALSNLEELREEEVTTHVPRPEKNTEKNRKDYADRIPRLNINAWRPPDNSRLNVFSLLHKEPHQNLPDEFSLYEIFARLMRSLYQHTAFFQEIPDVEYQILAQLIDKKEKTKNFVSADELSNLTMDDSKLQVIFYQMLKGTKHSASLLNYITFDQIDSPHKPSRKINFLFAHPLILKAIFPNGQVAEKLLEKREKLWDEILEQESHRLERSKQECKGRAAWSSDINLLLEQVLLEEGYDYKKYKAQVFDCTLGEPGSILFIEDPNTHLLTRKKYIPPAKKHS